jgi:hypothetical protein
MTTVVNNPGEGSGAGTIIGIVVAIILIALLFIYGLPAIRGGSAPAPGANINVTVPTGSSGGGAAE